MKKFLSICLVALCSVSAMYAQTASTVSRDEVACGTEISVQATAVGYNHLTRWEIQNGNGNNVLSTITVATDGTTSTTGTDYGATVTPGTDNTTGAETSTLTLTSQNSSTLINAATSRTVIFEAFFEIDQYTITGEANDGSSSSVTGSGTTTGNTSVTLTANESDCEIFHHWEALDSNDADLIADPTNRTLVVTPPTTWAHGSEHKFKAVFEPKKVTITVTTADDQKGTVKILAPTN